MRWEWRRGVPSLLAFLASCGLALPACAGAGPSVRVHAIEELGDGLTAYEVGVALGDSLEQSVFVDITFTGSFEQRRSGAQDVDDDQTAAVLDGTGGYVAARDSYFRTGDWPNRPFPIAGGQPGSTAYTAQLGSGGGSQVNGFIPVARLVLPDDELFSYDATISRHGVNFQMVPEPGRVVLLLAGVAGLAVLGRFARPERVARP